MEKLASKYDCSIFFGLGDTEVFNDFFIFFLQNEVTELVTLNPILRYQQGTFRRWKVGYKYDCSNLFEFRDGAFSLGIFFLKKPR